MCLNRQYPGFREEIVLVGKLFVHPHQISRKHMFLCDALDARVHVHFLVGMQLREKLWLHSKIVPCEIVDMRQLKIALVPFDSADFIFFTVNDPPVEDLTCNFADDFIVAAGEIYDYPLITRRCYLCSPLFRMRQTRQLRFLFLSLYSWFTLLLDTRDINDFSI